MPATLESIVHDALVLPEDQRLALACQLLDSVEPAHKNGGMRLGMLK